MDGHLSAYKHPVLATKFYRNLVYLRLFGGDLGRFNLGLGKPDSHKSTSVLQNDDYELIIETLTSTMRLILMTQTRTASAYIYFSSEFGR